MSSKVSICNMALAQLGTSSTGRIVSLSDNTVAANTCSLLIDEVIDRAIMQGSWTSAIRRANLALLVSTPEYGYTYQFQLPTNPFCLRVIGVDEATPNSTDYRIEGDKLLANYNTMKIRYLCRLTDTEDFDPMLTEAVETLLAAYLAIPLTGDKKLAEALFDRYTKLVVRNLALNGQQGSKEVIQATTFTEIR